MSLSLIIIAVTAIVSVIAFQNRMLFDKLLLSPYMIVHEKQWYRAITHGFIHANWMHLIINMLVFYSFSDALMYFLTKVSNYPNVHFFIIYFVGMIFASISTIVKNRDKFDYRGVGASGAVSAIMFAYIFFDPWQKLLFFGIIPVPGILFGVLYLLYCTYMSRNSNDGINHDAHFYGAIFGFLYPLVINPKLFGYFIDAVSHPYF